MVCLGFEPGAADETTELWRPPDRGNVIQTSQTGCKLHSNTFILHLVSPYFIDLLMSIELVQI